MGGNDWAEVTPVEQLTRFDRKAVNAVIVFEQNGGKPVVRASMDDDMAEAIIERVVTDWSLPFPVPGQDPHRPAVGDTPENPGSINKLSLEQDDALRKAVQPHIKAILGQNAPTPANEIPTAAFVS